MTTSTLAHRTRGVHIRGIAASAVLAGALFVSGCASTPPPTAQLAVATAAIAHATAAGAAETAPLELGMARDKLNRAQMAVANKDMDTALSLAQQAQLDAQLAEAKGEAARSRKAADALGEAGRALREELTRKAP
jgi:hypothetical protein